MKASARRKAASGVANDEAYLTARSQETEANRNNLLNVVFAAATACLIGAMPRVLQAAACQENCASTKRVCATWDQGGDPVLNVDFTVTYEECGDAPEVVLVTGGSPAVWSIYSEVIDGGAPANLGEVIINPDDEDSDEDFVVKLAKGAGAGAANVGALDLDRTTATDWTGFSSIDDSLISGDMLGAIEVVQEGTSGGAVTLEIQGDAEGAITIPVLDYLKIHGDLTANLSVTGTINAGSLIILGDVTSTVSITDMTGSSEVRITTSPKTSEHRWPFRGPGRLAARGAVLPFRHF